MTNRAQQIFKPEFRFGLGGVSLGNEFNKHTDKDAEATLEAAWAVGVRYFDVAPWCHSACNIDPLSRGIGVQN
jgi:D-threo-aldose 1-dehydrogenase